MKLGTTSVLVAKLLCFGLGLVLYVLRDHGSGLWIVIGVPGGIGIENSLQQIL
jgi:hypothetical protein